MLSLSFLGTSAVLYPPAVSGSLVPTHVALYTSVSWWHQQLRSPHKTILVNLYLCRHFVIHSSTSIGMLPVISIKSPIGNRLWLKWLPLTLLPNRLHLVLGFYAEDPVIFVVIHRHQYSLGSILCVIQLRILPIIIILTATMQDLIMVWSCCPCCRCALSVCAATQRKKAAATLKFKLNNSSNTHLS
jgi:hypothetical protein